MTVQSQGSFSLQAIWSGLWYLISGFVPPVMNYANQAWAKRETTPGDLKLLGYVVFVDYRVADEGRLC